MAIPIAAAAGVAVLAAALFVARRASSPAPGSWKGKNVLVITVDTLRADRLGAYGFREIRTPAIDSLASNGVLFESCMTAAPLTLPSHTSLFTGTYPLHHGVRDNGGFVVPPQATTLAELFRTRGYATAAFVGAFVLDSRWGLDQGFETYGDDFEMRSENIVSLGDIERPGNEVVDAALAWLRARDRRSFFLWIHLFDPHSPYDPPPPFREQYAGRPYVGEIAFADSQIGRVLEYLDSERLRRDTVVVFAGDHGESLGEHEEQGHGYFVYQSTLRVPLIVSAARIPSGRRAETVSLVDVFPTIVEMSGLAPPSRTDGRSLVPLLGGRGRRDPAPVYSETYYPRMHYGWSALRSIQDGRFKLIESSEPELYDLKNDPTEQRNLAQKDRNSYLEWKRRAAVWLERWSRDAIPNRPRTEDPETVARLASLGYIGAAGASPDVDESRLPSPRAKIGIYNRLEEARELAEGSDLDGAKRLLEEIVASDPGVIDAYTALGNLLLKQKNYDEASEAYRRALDLKPVDPMLALGLASTEVERGRAAEAEKVLHASLQFNPSDSRLYLLLGTIAESRKEREKAAAYFAKVVELDPKSGAAESALAEAAFDRGDLVAAERHVVQALEKDPKVRGAHYYRARILESRGEIASALAEYRLELEVNPKDQRALLSALVLFRKTGRLDEQESFLRSLVARSPDLVAAYLQLARLHLDRGNDLETAVSLVERALTLRPKGTDLPLAYFLMADLQNRIGNERLSREYAERGRAAAAGLRGK